MMLSSSARLCLWRTPRALIACSVEHILDATQDSLAVATCLLAKMCRGGGRRLDGVGKESTHARSLSFWARTTQVRGAGRVCSSLGSHLRSYPHAQSRIASKHEERLIPNLDLFQGDE